MTTKIALNALFVACAVVSLASTMPVAAHHSFAAEFDSTKPVKLTGVVTKVEWLNPHSWFFLDVTDEAGKVQNWAFELGSPNGLIRAGWTKNTLKLGDQVTVEGTRARDGKNIANARMVILVATGKRLFAASSEGQNP
jgi:hypothetical protein